MKIEEVEEKLKDAKYSHLVDDVLISYHDRKLDDVDQARAEAHLNLCPRCESRLSLLLQERAEADEYESSAEDVVLVKRALQRRGAQKPPAAAPSVRERLAMYFRPAAEIWHAFAMQLVAERAATPDSVEIWRSISEDGRFLIVIRLEATDDLTLHFSSSNLEFEGEPFEIKIGRQTIEGTLKRISETEIGDDIVIPRLERPKAFTDISFKVD